VVQRDEDPRDRGSKSVSPRARVLIVDDDPVMQKLMIFVLRDYDLVVKGDAREALATLAAGESFDLILCDLNMPGMDGMEFYAALTPALRNRMVLITGGALTDVSHRFSNQVGPRVLIKPVELKRLRAAVAEVLEQLAPN
jgi:CheY-like chemotaxis protein